MCYVAMALLASDRLDCSDCASPIVPVASLGILSRLHSIPHPGTMAEPTGARPVLSVAAVAQTQHPGCPPRMPYGTLAVKWN